MPDAPTFTVVPPFRCYFRYQEPERGLCAAPATKERPGLGPFHCGFYCELHARDGDKPILAPTTIRRVSLQVEVLLTAVSWDQTTSQAEAVRSLELAVEAVGGVLSLASVTSLIGHVTGPAPVRTWPAGAGNGAAAGVRPSLASGARAPFSME